MNPSLSTAPAQARTGDRRERGSCQRRSSGTGAAGLPRAVRAAQQRSLQRSLAPSRRRRRATNAPPRRRYSWLGRGCFDFGPFWGPLGNSRNVVYGRSKLHKTVVSRSGTIVLVYFVVWHCSKRNLSTVEKRLSAEGPLSMHMAGRWACGAKARERWQEGAVESTRREYCVCF